MQEPKNTLRTQKLIVGLCALMAVTAMTKTAVSIYRKDAKNTKFGLIGSALTGGGFALSVAGYLIDPDRRRRR